MLNHISFLPIKIIYLWVVSYIFIIEFLACWLCKVLRFSLIWPNLFMIIYFLNWISWYVRHSFGFGERANDPSDPNYDPFRIIRVWLCLFCILGGWFLFTCICDTFVFGYILFVHYLYMVYIGLLTIPVMMTWSTFSFRVWGRSD